MSQRLSACLWLTALNGLPCFCLYYTILFFVCQSLFIYAKTFSHGCPILSRFTHLSLYLLRLSSKSVASAVRASPVQGLPSGFLSPERYRMGSVSRNHRFRPSSKPLPFAFLARSGSPFADLNGFLPKPFHPRAITGAVCPKLFHNFDPAPSQGSLDWARLPKIKKRSTYRYFYLLRLSPKSVASNRSPSPFRLGSRGSLDWARLPKIALRF